MSSQNNNKKKFGLKALHVKNFHGIKDLLLEDIPEGAPWIFLTGKNGYGKTSLLQAIFIGIFGKQDGKIILVDNQEEIKVTRYELPPAYDNFRERQNIAAYGSSRLKLQLGAYSIENDGQGSPSYSLFNQGGVLWNIEETLKNWYYRGQTEKLDRKSRNRLLNYYDETIEILKKLMPNIAEINVDIKKDQILYYEKDNEGQRLKEPVQFHQLAAGNKSIISMTGDLLIRLINGDWDLESMAIKDVTGYVIIDELDLHLHPEWQKKLPGLLSEIFPNVQFIASTHSPIPFLGAPEGSVFIKVNRTAEEGITVEKLDIDIKNLTPNLILSSAIFGFTEIFPVTHEAGERIRTEDTMEDVKKEDDIVNELKSFLGKDKEKRLERLLKP